MSQNKTFQVVNMVSEEDLRIVKNALQQLTGMSSVEVHYPSKHVTVEWSDVITWEDIERALDELGYTVA